MLLAILLCGCGGGGSSSDLPAAQAVATQLVAGFVEDGPVVDARVYLVASRDQAILQRCGAAGRGSCETRTDDSGHFSFLLDESVDPGDVLVVVSGGSDGNTGFDFSSMEMHSRLDFFAGDVRQVLVSPVTTLVAYGRQAGLSLADSLQSVAGNLRFSGLPAQLLESPEGIPELLNRTLLLSKMAAALLQTDPGQEPFATLAGTLSTPGPVLMTNVFPDTAQLSTLGLPADSRQQVEEMRQQLASNPQEQESVFIREELFQALRNIALRSLAGTGFDPEDAAFVANGHTLAEEVRLALSPALVPLNGVAPQRLARYLLHAYGLNDAATLGLPAADFALLLQGDQATGLPAVSQNPLLAELAALRTLYSVKVPLLADEMTGDDSTLRRDYYYHSDRSHLYQVEKLVGLVSDDTVNDPLMVAVADGLSEAGLFTEAEKLLQTQVYQSADLADGWLELARSEVEHGLFAPAKGHLDQAYAAIRRVLDNTAPSLISSHQTLVLASIAANYRKAGYLTETTAVLDYLRQLATTVTSTSTYGKFFIGMRDLAEDYLAAGDLVHAGALVDDLLTIALLTPANEKLRTGVTYHYYQLRVFNLREVMRLYAELGRSAEVFQVYQEVQALRANDGLQNLTLNATWYDASQMVEVLYRSGYADEALNLANSIPASYSNYYGATRSGLFYQSNAFMSVATWEALNNGYAAGLAVLNAHFTTASDLVEGLTYFALNAGNPRIGLALLEAGRLGEAVQALDEATRLLDGQVETSDRNIYRNLVERGYVKVAKLYVQAGDPVTAATLLGKAEGALSAVTAADYRNDGLIAIALGYHAAGMTAARNQLFAQAYSEAAAAAPLLTALETAQLYEAIADGLVASDERDGLLPGVAADLAAVAATIHDPVRDQGASNFDNLAKSEVGMLLSAARYFNLMKDSSGSFAVLQVAEQTAGEILVDTTRMAQLVAVAGAYAEGGFVDDALSLAESLPFVSSRNEARQAIAESFAAYDDFPGTEVARVDTDGDGLPNFWSPLADAAAIAASGLVLDPDSDNDGIPDLTDNRPLYVDP